MEVGDSLTQCFGNVSKFCLEITESNTGIIGIFRINRFICFRAWDEYHDTPVIFSIMPIRFTSISFYESQYLTVYIGFSLFSQFTTDVVGY